MAVPEEMAWEPRLPNFSHRTRQFARRSSAQPVPERFPIVVVDILATLTFDPALATHSPRNARLTHRPQLVSEVYDPVAALHPLVWAPGLPAGTRRTWRELRRRLHQSSVEPAPQGVIAAQRMTWMPTLPARTKRLQLRPRETGAVRTIEFSVFATGVLCIDLTGDAVTSPDLLVESITSPDLITESLTSPGLINEVVC